MIELICPYCKKVFIDYACNNRKFCSTSCKAKQQQIDAPHLKNNLIHKKGNENNRWNGGKTIDRYGYTLIALPNYPKANSKGYYPLHRYVMEKHLGRFLDSTELVHHINHIKTDNRIKNLMITTRREHLKMHQVWNKGLKGYKQPRGKPRVI